MIEVNVQDELLDLQSLLKQVENGEEIVFARDGHPVARLAGYPTPQKYRVAGLDAGPMRKTADLNAPGNDPNAPRVLGLDAGYIWIADNFDDPLPPDLQQYFE